PCRQHVSAKQSLYLTRGVGLGMRPCMTIEESLNDRNDSVGLGRGAGSLGRERFLTLGQPEECLPCHFPGLGEPDGRIAAQGGLLMPAAVAVADRPALCAARLNDQEERANKAVRDLDSAVTGGDAADPRVGESGHTTYLSLPFG